MTTDLFDESGLEADEIDFPWDEFLPDEDDAELEVLVFADDEPAGVVVDVWPVVVVLAEAPDVGDADGLGDVVAEEGVVDVVVV